MQLQHLQLFTYTTKCIKLKMFALQNKLNRSIPKWRSWGGSWNNFRILLTEKKNYIWNDNDKLGPNILGPDSAEDVHKARAHKAQILQLHTLSALVSH